jgi:hypothetical protein
MKKLILILLLLPTVLLAYPSYYVSTNPAVTSLRLSVTVSGTAYGYDGVYQADAVGTNWNGVAFSNGSLKLQYATNVSRWVLWDYVSDGDYYRTGGIFDFAGLYTGELTYSGTCLVTQNPNPQYYFATGLTNFWPTNGGNAHLFARGVAMSNSVVLLSLNSNVIFQSAVNVADGALWRVEGDLGYDGSNLVSMVNYYSGSTESGVLNTLTNFSVTNVNLAMGVDLAHNTNLTITSVKLTGEQAVAGVQPVYVWPPVISPLTSVVFTNNTNVSVVQVFNVGGVAGYSITASNTNTITAYNFTNQVFSSAKITLTNRPAFNLTGSNYIGRFSQVYKYQLTLPSLGGGGMAPGTNPTEVVYFSLTGTNAWFAATNTTPRIFTNVSVAIVGANIGTNASALTIYGLDHPELSGRVNTLEDQTLDASGSTLVTKDALAAALAGAQGLWITTLDTNGVSHSVLTKNGQTLVDMATSLAFVPINSFALDGTGTNAALAIYTTNLTSGWIIESVTNLLYLNSWQTFTNYSMATNTGVVTFTIPINWSLDSQFFRARGNITNLFTVNAPIVATAGTYYPSNSFNLASITNSMGNFGFWTGNSNGQALVTLSLSNGVVRYLQVLK